VANSTAGSILDGDDLHWPSWLHAGASIVPAGLAVAEETGASFEEMLDAITMGYEISCRIAQFVDWDRMQQIATGHWCGYGVAAAAARLRGTSAEVLARAFALVAALTPMVLPRGSTINQNDVKEGIAWGTLAGLQALDLAQAGLTGPERGLETDVLDLDKTLSTIGGPTPVVSELAFKPYVSCAWTHAGVDALTGLMREHELDAADIDVVEIVTYTDVVTHLDPVTNPSSLQQAQYSYPFVLGVAAWHGAAALLPLVASSLGDPRVEDFARRVSISASEELDRQLPENRPVEVTVRTSKGVFERALAREANPADDASVTEKFMRMTEGFWSLAHAQRTARLVLSHRGDVAELTACLAQPVATPSLGESTKERRVIFSPHP
jgi:2-methylcitrate dehydratase PrpD